MSENNDVNVTFNKQYYTSEQIENLCSNYNGKIVFDNTTKRIYAGLDTNGNPICYGSNIDTIIWNSDTNILSIKNIDGTITNIGIPITIPITKDKLDTKLFGTQTVTSLSNISTNYRETHVIITEPGVLSFSQQPEEGCPIEIYIDHLSDGDFNELEGIVVTLPNSGNYKCICPSNLTILEGEFAKVTARTFGGITYIDAQTFYYVDYIPITSISEGETIENVLFIYGKKYVGMSDSHTTITTTNVEEAILDNHYLFNIIYKETGRVAIQCCSNNSYYLNNNGNWSTTQYSWYWDGFHFVNTNKTDGSGRLYLNGTTLTVGKTNGGIWNTTHPIKAAK